MEYFLVFGLQGNDIVAIVLDLVDLVEGGGLLNDESASAIDGEVGAVFLDDLFDLGEGGRRGSDEGIVEVVVYGDCAVGWLFEAFEEVGELYGVGGEEGEVVVHQIFYIINNFRIFLFQILMKD